MFAFSTDTLEFIGPISILVGICFFAAGIVWLLGQVITVLRKRGARIGSVVFGGFCVVLGLGLLGYGFNYALPTHDKQFRSELTTITNRYEQDRTRRVEPTVREARFVKAYIDHCYNIGDVDRVDPATHTAWLTAFTAGQRYVVFYKIISNTVRTIPTNHNKC